MIRTQDRGEGSKRGEIISVQNVAGGRHCVDAQDLVRCDDLVDVRNLPWHINPFFIILFAF